jgi:cytochrome c-type protein NapC
MAEKDPGASGWRRAWRALWRPSVRWSVASLVALGVIAGILFWGGFHTALEMTNTLAFCANTCHEMTDNVYAEYKETIHYQNRTGVRAICSDCHVPREWGHKVLRKVKATGELYGHLIGEISTKEKFEKNRMRLAQNEWRNMKATDSRECRNCHSFAAMQKTKQRPRAQKNHATAEQRGTTCIDCHKGIAHLLPAEYDETTDEANFDNSPAPAAPSSAAAAPAGGVPAVTGAAPDKPTAKSSEEPAAKNK